MKTMHESTAADQDFDNEVVQITGGDRMPRRMLLVASALSVAAAALATTLALVRRRRTAAPRGAPQSTINVNWGFALFGSNVMAERRRRFGGPFRRQGRR